MHELSIALSIVDIACDEGERLGAHVSAVHLKLGTFAGVVKDALVFSYDVACQDTPLEGSRLVIEEVPLVVFCSQCQMERVLPTMQSFCCEECGAPTPEVRSGRELQVVALEIDS
jgi:hydrogenase nickel incorporation protein HypA/HybF